MMQELGIKVSVFGKHPSTSEYLYLGESSNFMNSIVSWIKAGYEVLLKNRQKYPSHRVQHFYFSNRDGDSFVCASFKLSRDENAREYPLVILVEVPETQQNKDYKSIWCKNLDILHSVGSLEELENSLSKYEPIYNNETFKDFDIDVLAAFINEDFSKTKLFFKPLQVDDFIEMMR